MQKRSCHYFTSYLLETDPNTYNPGILNLKLMVQHEYGTQKNDVNRRNKKIFWKTFSKLSEFRFTIDNGSVGQTWANMYLAEKLNCSIRYDSQVELL